MKRNIDYVDLLKITDAFQVSSGQNYAIERTKILLDYVKNGSVLSEELTDIFREIDQAIDLKKEVALEKYFG